MAFRKTKYILGINGVAPGQTATVKVPVGERFHGVDLFAKNNGVDDVSKINAVRLSMGGAQFQVLTRAELIALYEENLNSANAGHIPIPFSEPSRATVIDSEITAWDTAGERDFEIAVDIDPTAVNPSLKIIGSTDNEMFTDRVTGKRIKQPLRRLPLNQNPPAGWFDINNLPNDSPIAAIRINAGDVVTPGDITAFEVLLGGEKVAEGTWQENQKLLEAQGYDATKFTLPIIFARDHRIANALDPRIMDANGNVVGLKPIVVRVQMASAMKIKIITDQVRFGFN